MQINMIQFPAIRWSILIAFGSYLATPQLARNKSDVITLLNSQMIVGLHGQVFPCPYYVIARRINWRISLCRFHPVGRRAVGLDRAGQRRAAAKRWFGTVVLPCLSIWVAFGHTYGK
jgi:hypothetical protein